MGKLQRLRGSTVWGSVIYNLSEGCRLAQAMQAARTFDPRLKRWELLEALQDEALELASWPDGFTRAALAARYKRTVRCMDQWLLAARSRKAKREGAG